VNSNYWKKNKWIVFGICCFEANVDRTKPTFGCTTTKEQILFESTTIQTNQTSHQIDNNNTTPNQKKTRDATSNNNLAWIEGRNYHAKNMNMTKFFQSNE